MSEIGKQQKKLNIKWADTRGTVSEQTECKWAEGNYISIQKTQM